jgi:uncharacterized membrane protein YhaH (DUF805 family)
VSFTDAVKLCFHKYADFSGRASRPEFWWFALFQVAALVVAQFFGDWLYMLVALALVLPGLAVGSRRLHDIGKSGWFQLIWLIPLIGLLLLLYWFAQPGTGPNQYGNPEVTPYSPTVMPGTGPGPGPGQQ